MGDCLFNKVEQPQHADRNAWQQKYDLD